MSDARNPRPAHGPSRCSSRCISATPSGSMTFIRTRSRAAWGSG
ncbi:hypothetical protein R2601_03033 [Salipiger bermudensis HTCC2601]|uniref:Uncharacterized protein n=1 Tax=Salipiger bermudensis (strain DSM 26914 / JCM 13377 / KCTC 12554 / HTCC2601) TaxID=314265 RepID=Q0FWN9_SALBH|nr:hypothetical protein R2601_03033 [Salipiger bermudensis HTCC2601]